jgi:hypothetical protein
LILKYRLIAKLGDVGAISIAQRRVRVVLKISPAFIKGLGTLYLILGGFLMRRGLILLAAMLLLVVFGALAGCSLQQSADSTKPKLTEQDVRSAVTELVNGINNGNVQVVEKYVGTAGSVAEQLVEKLKNNIKLSNIRDISINGTNASAIVTLEVVPLNIKKDVTLNFNATDVLMLNNPLGLLAALLM